MQLSSNACRLAAEHVFPDVPALSSIPLVTTALPLCCAWFLDVVSIKPIDIHVMRGWWAGGAVDPDSKLNCFPGNDHILNSTRWDYDVCESSLHGPSIRPRELDRHVYKCPILQFSESSSSPSELRNTQTCLGGKPGRDDVLERLPDSSIPTAHQTLIPHG